jgi:hypothetical protein
VASAVNVAMVCYGAVGTHKTASVVLGTNMCGHRWGRRLHVQADPYLYNCRRVVPPLVLLVRKCLPLALYLRLEKSLQLKQ